MAITKIHAVKTTICRSVNYICNPEKTDDEFYISSFATSPETAADDFKFTLCHTAPSDPNLAYHLIQSFAPGEVSAAEAHKIGIELADRILGGRYSFIVSTHTDKEHIHNHILFCAADNIDYKKYHDCKKSYWNIRHISDELCEAHNLSVIRENKHLAKSYKEWQASKNGTSWKSKLKTDIDKTIKCSHSYEEFISLIQAAGYEIRDYEFSESAHKYISFRAPGQERFIRGREKSLGPEYTKERIRDRIGENIARRHERMLKMYRGSGKMIDTSQERFTESPGLKKWAEKQNLKEAARVQSLLAEKGLQNFQELDEKIDSLHLKSKTARKATVSFDKQLKDAGEILRYARQYSEKHKYEVAYEKSKEPERYYRDHREDIQLAWGARTGLESLGLNPTTLKLSEIEENYRKMTADRETAHSTYVTAEKECNELKKLRDELTSYMGMEQEQAQEKDHDKKPSL